MQTKTTLTLDDRSPNITYAGGTWNLGGVPGEFAGTSTWTSDAGSTATISFLGQYVSSRKKRFVRCLLGYTVSRLADQRIRHHPPSESTASQTRARGYRRRRRIRRITSIIPPWILLISLVLEVQTPPSPTSPLPPPPRPPLRLRLRPQRHRHPIQLHPRLQLHHIIHAPTTM